MNKKTCFVIMPFGNTDSTKKSEWTSIYDNIIKPAVESSDFVCKRSKPTRGNMIKEIVNDLNDSDLVIADMTDLNPNVCYELGIRHGLKTGTILLAQDREFLKIFDLHNYASHVYDEKTRTKQNKIINKIKELIVNYLDNPKKPDNPVDDFLGNVKQNTKKSKALERVLMKNITKIKTQHLVIISLKMRKKQTKDEIQKTLKDWGKIFNEWFRGGNFNNRLINANIVRSLNDKSNKKKSYELTQQGNMRADELIEEITNDFKSYK